MSSVDASWDNSPSKAWFHLLCHAPSRSTLQRFLKWWHSDRSGTVEHESLVSQELQPGEGALLAGGLTAAGTWLAFPEEEHPLGWLRAGDMPGLVLLMGKAWQLPIIQNILVVSLGYFFWDTFLDDCSYLYLCFHKHSQYPCHFQLGNWNTASFYLFICLFLFCLMWLLWALLSLLLHFVCQ